MRLKTAGLAAAYAVGVATLVLAQTAAPAGSNRVGIINIQDAIIRTKEGQKTAKTLQDKYAPRQDTLEKSRRELEDLQGQLNKGRNTMSEDARNILVRQIDQKTRALQRDNEDASAEFQQEEAKVINAIGQKMMAVIDKYAKDKAYSIILDISSPQSPVLYAVNTVDITNDIVDLYDKSQGEAGPAAGSAPPPTGGVRKAPVAAPPRAPAAPPRPPAATPKQ